MQGRYKNVVFIRYEDLAEYPARELHKVYAALGIEEYQHDFEAVVSTAPEIDALYHNKFPHKGEGKVEVGTSKWSDYFDSDLAHKIISRYPTYCAAFGYR